MKNMGGPQKPATGPPKFEKRPWPSDTLLQRLGIDDVLAVLRCRRPEWFGDVGRAAGCINSVVELRVPAAPNVAGQEKHGKNVSKRT